ncbi:D-isomer specific 2-hydroxyacid dehydrogenase NAD-binding [Methylobacterium sp. 4-46]|uniref:D-2-hydroxyacid dehydrogenase n=1 Tax=unclassified Methylobacterium TaxID=2615210 RepID=UPI000152E632|nr:MULTISPECIES: D-2-hydroxyacid dehydrogenase [Methylobacterium]ACA17845.1 D-isomer specific 2-hydroxyacid dehydrogenase NAD-binding [Methylobacterium sp. 4-46]WFT77151.1 D-2-hydroxyacid dehydrogenase [Methylobacterium nodulans]
MAPLPPPEALTIGFAHPAYRLHEEFAARGHPARAFAVESRAALRARLAEADVLVVSGLWHDDMIAAAPRLRLIQSVSAGTDQFDRDRLAAAGIRLASAQGANAGAVAEHAMALILSLQRQLHRARDHQAARHWRPMIADRAAREEESAGRTLVIVGLGGIGRRLAGLARAFGFRVVGVRRQAVPCPEADAVVPPGDLLAVLPRADIVALTCPLTRETEGLIGKAALAALKPGALLVNVARGRVVDEAALLRALREGRLAGAGLDCFHDEPLPPDSPFWALPQVIVTPHSAGETRHHETRVVDLLLDNLARLGRGETALRNGVV